LAAVEIFQGSVAALVAVVQHTRAALLAPQRGLGLGAEDQPPAAAHDRISHRTPSVAAPSTPGQPAPGCGAALRRPAPAHAAASAPAPRRPAVARRPAARGG